LQLDGHICKKITIALTNMASTAIRVKEAEALLMGSVIDDTLIAQAAQKAIAACDPTEDLRGNREYKIQMAGEMTRRAIRLALTRARG
jgi:carbon-monoxide dehydrogenase medium subunit